MLMVVIMMMMVMMLMMMMKMMMVLFAPLKEKHNQMPMRRYLQIHLGVVFSSIF